MKILGKVVRVILLVVTAAFVSGYFIIVFLLPKYLNSAHFAGHLDSYLSQNFGLNYRSEGTIFTVTPKLKISAKASEIELLNSSGEKVALIENLNSSFAGLHPKSFDFSASNVFVDAKHLKKSEGKGFSSKPILEFLNSFDVKNLTILFSGANNEEFAVNVKNLRLQKFYDVSVLTFDASLRSRLVKNGIFAGKSGGIVLSDKKIVAQNLSVFFGSQKLLLNGLIADSRGNNDLKITGKNISVHDFEAALVYFLKLRKKEKVFIENFYDFSGLIDVNLKFKNKGLFGHCIVKNLAAKTVLFNVPASFKKADFMFDGKTLSLQEFGILGNDKVFTAFKTENLFTPELTTSGTVQSALTAKTVDKYVPDAILQGVAHAKVDYFVKNHKITVDYSLDFAKGSQLFYKNANLGLKDKKRKLKVQTFKDGNSLDIVFYRYSAFENSAFKDIVTGKGHFDKQKDKFALKFLTCKTNGFAPVALTGSFGKFIDGGMFSGDLYYYHPAKRLTGNFKVINSRYKHFRLKEAVLSADNSNMQINAFGTFYRQPFRCSLVAQNDFANDKVNIYDLDLYLEKFIIKNRSHTAKKFRFDGSRDFSNKIPSKIADKVSDVDITVHNWKIKVDKIVKNRIVFENIYFFGNLKNDIFTFKTHKIKFAGGTLYASGRYDFKTYSSLLDFYADDIDSNTVSDVVFNLPGQIYGKASAKLHAKTFNHAEKFLAHAEFNVKKGCLPKLGSTEFMLNKKHPIKFTVQNLVNIDITPEKAFTSDIKGSFDLDGSNMKNINLTSEQKYLSFLIEGDYDIKSQNTDFDLWGKYNIPSGQKIRILHIPISWIIKFLLRPEYTYTLYKHKFDKVPPVQALEKDIRTFRVKVNGNINSSENLNVEMKSIY